MVKLVHNAGEETVMIYVVLGKPTNNILRILPVGVTPRPRKSPQN